MVVLLLPMALAAPPYYLRTCLSSEDRARRSTLPVPEKMNSNTSYQRDQNTERERDLWVAQRSASFFGLFGLYMKEITTASDLPLELLAISSTTPCQARRVRRRSRS
jgi:hypothetical protein